MATLTRCLHCGETFEGGVVIVGRPTARLQALLVKLASHMNQKHPDFAQGMNLDGVTFMGWRYLTNFKSDDEDLNSESDKQRWMIHQQTLPYRMDDDVLKKQAGELAALLSHQAISEVPEELRNKYASHAIAWEGDMKRSFAELILETFTQLRDALEEPNKYELPKVGQLVTH